MKKSKDYSTIDVGNCNNGVCRMPTAGPNVY